MKTLKDLAPLLFIILLIVFLFVFELNVTTDWDDRTVLDMTIQEFFLIGLVLTLFNTRIKD